MKKFIIRLLIVCSPVIVLYAYPMLRFANGESFGDLSQLGNYFFDKEYLPMMDYSPGFKRHVILAEDVTEEVCDSDVLVIGDSFTQIGFPNFMEYLQDLFPLRSIFGVHTYMDQEWRYIHKSLEGSGRLLSFPGKTDLVLYLLYHAKRLPSTIVIESSEMWLMETVLRTNFDICEDSLADYDGAPLMTSQEKYERYSQLLISPSPMRCIFNGRAFDFAQDWIKRRAGVTTNPVKKSILSKPMFTNNGDENTLYYLPYAMIWQEEEVEKMRYLMNRIIDEGAKRDVNIIFMVIPLKEHVYENEMIAGKGSATYLSDYLTDRAPNPHYLICQPILREMIEGGEKDVFLANDTHWSYKGARACAEALKSKIDSGKR